MMKKLSIIAILVLCAQAVCAMDLDLLATVASLPHYSNRNANHSQPSINPLALSISHEIHNDPSIDQMIDEDILTDESVTHPTKKRKTTHDSENFNNNNNNNPETHQCSSCQKTFKNRSILKAHEKRHNVIPHVCSTCGQTFTSDQGLAGHMTSHNPEDQFYCGYEGCPKNVPGNGYPYRCSLEYHIKIEHEQEKLYKCPHCNKGFGRKDYCDKHILTCNANNNSNNNLEPYQCFSCSKTFESKSLRTAHAKEQHNPTPYQCPSCPEAFESKSLRTAHEKEQHNLTPYQCPSCPEAFESKSLLKAHEKRHNVILHVCSKCDKIFTSDQGLAGHMTSHNPDKQFYCGYEGCERNAPGNGYPYPASLAYHIKMEHEQASQLKCPHCNKGFGRKDLFDKHTLICDKNNDLETYKCSSCPETFESKSLLKAHKKEQHNPAPSTHSTYACLTCPETFQSQIGLTDHMRSHNPDDQFYCGYEGCERNARNHGYIQRSSLEYHIKMKHEQATQFKCEKCNKGFGRKDHFEKHTLICNTNNNNNNNDDNSDD